MSGDCSLRCPGDPSATHTARPTAPRRVPAHPPGPRRRISFAGRPRTLERATPLCASCRDTRTPAFYAFDRTSFTPAITTCQNTPALTNHPAWKRSGFVREAPTTLKATGATIAAMTRAMRTTGMERLGLTDFPAASARTLVLMSTPTTEHP